jgi:hypothetical protein
VIAGLKRVVLRDDQWDLVVLSLEHIIARCSETEADTVERIHRLTRKVTKRRCAEAVNDIKKQVPLAGKE